MAAKAVYQWLAWQLSWRLSMSERHQYQRGLSNLDVQSGGGVARRNENVNNQWRIGGNGGVAWRLSQWRGAMWRRRRYVSAEMSM